MTMALMHAWSVLCDRVFIDSGATNRVALGAAEQLTLYSTPPAQAPGARAAVALELSVLSLWYLDGELPEGSQARVRIVGPSGTELFSLPFDTNFEGRTRLRTRLNLGALPWDGFGRYYFLIERGMQNSFDEVARVPLEAVLGERPPVSQR